MLETPEFAEQYTRAERLRLALIILPPALALLLAAKLWFSPWLAAFAATAGCRDIGGVNGIVVLNYGLFVGLPLLFAALAGLVLGVPGYRSLRSGQFPAPGTKVFSPRRIVRGWRATLYGTVHLLPAGYLLGVMIWGCFAAGEAVAKAQASPVGCAVRLPETPHLEAP
ncbi:hypothetical protein PO883_11890 [Massilia sp. DJPM01]|uniref:hypothetical protein n=1 Tax=Massilia sp. DJPM01 TaxID=3024404 RepID=UPI00259E18E4|nr:hypothetical protein [Massilia sp. DJPM01]MDM5177893.1 hypothetical protein [Massilia sp. DJPM01]